LAPATHQSVMAAIATTPVEDVPALIALAAAGDQAAFTAIVRAYHEDMRRVCVVVAGDENIADDAVASAWAIAWRRLGSVRDASRLRPWLVSVAVNEARQLLRSTRRRAVTEIDVSTSKVVPAGGPNPGDSVDLLDLRNALSRLAPEDRALLAMRYVVGFEAVELAFATGRSASGTRARLGRLLQRLEKELEDE